MRTYRVEAIVIRKRNFLEKDRILTLFSKERGKIDALAKGARRPISRLAAYSDIGCVARFYIHGTNSIDIVSDIKPIFMPEGARGKLCQTHEIGTIFKIIDRVFEKNVAHPKTYYALNRILRVICEHNFQLPFLVFLSRLISDLGIEPALFHCNACERKIMSGEKLVFTIEGGVQHLSCASASSDPIDEKETKFLRLIFKAPFEKILRAKVDRKIFQKVDKLLRLYLNWHLGDIL
jgi:DNA repair protein RecO (recombination protein O)